MESSEGNNEVIIEEKNPLRTDQSSSSDLLKNTPSNIARLEDVIVHCEGRKKYLATTKSSSDGEDVRWYFYKIPLGENELAASIPRTEIVGKGEYFRFSTRDSLALEASFLQREEELLSRWWSEYAECSEGPIEPPISSDIKHDLNPKLSEGVRARQLLAADEERVGVPVKGGLFEVDLVKRHCFPVYWSGENRRVLRGHWFALKAGLNWLPLREDVAEQLEFAYRSQVWHRRTFQQSGLFAARIDLQGSTLGLHALFTGEDDTWEAWLNVDASGFSNMIGIRGNGIKLRRGYSPHGSTKPTQDEVRQQKEEEMDDYCSQVPVRHLVFMVHGIGQRLEKANLVDDVGDFRRITASLAELHLTKHQRNTQRVLFIPCQWRRGLKLGGESTVENITLDGVRGLRTMLSATVHDVLYYMSPIYCQDIINSVSNQLNRLYMKFITRNPGYDGKVSIYAHSLGTVLSYDILCHQEKLSSLFLVDWMHKEHGRNQESQSGGTNLSSESISLPESNEQAHVSFEQSLEPKQATNSLLSDDDRRESYQCSSDILSLERGSLDESTSIGCEVPDGVSDKLVESTSENASDESKSIKLLREEVHSLRARIAELESQCGSEARDKEYQDDKEVDIGTSNQSLPQKLAPEQENMNNGYKPYIKYTKLEFKVDTFFAVGSPLGFFLSLRNIRIGIGKGQDYWQDERIAEEMPACRQMFNIFHPFDPVAYRVEPLVCKDYISKRPILIPYHKGGKRLHIGIQEFTEDLATRSQAVADHLRSMRVKVLRVCQSRNSDDMEDTTENDEETEGRSYGSIMMERLTGSEEGRIDHMLQDKTFEYQYISAIGSHTNYWRDPDTALFILKHLYSDIPTEPNLPDQPSRGNSKDQKAASTGLYYQSEIMDETVPLVFSDGGAVDKEEFSGEVKKEMDKH